MKKFLYAFIVMATTLAACEPFWLQEPQEYPYSKITVLRAMTGDDTAEDEDYGNLFDGNYTNKWCSVENFGGTYEERTSGQGGFDYIIWKTESKIKLSGYKLTTGNDTEKFTDRNWKTWAIYGANFSNDNEARSSAEGWTLVQKVENDNVLQPVNFTDFYFEVPGNKTAYQYYKLVIEAIQSTIDNVHQMSEMTLYARE